MLKNLSDYAVGHIRVFTANAVGWALSNLAVFGLVLDGDESQAVVSAATVLTTAAYYALVRLLAESVPWIGVLLCVNAAPQYPSPLDPPAGTR